MKKHVLFYLFILCATLGRAQLSATVDGGVETTIDCGQETTVVVNNNNKPYIATALNGTLIIDPVSLDEVSLLFSNASSFMVKTVFGGGDILITDANDTTVQDTVSINVTPLESLVDQIISANGNNESDCMLSDGNLQLSISADARAGNVSYSWFVAQGGQYTRIEGSRNTDTVTLKSLNPGTSLIGVRISNDCSGDLCNSVTRYFRIRKTLSESDKDIAIRGPECASDDVLGQDNIIVLAIPPVLGLYDKGQYQWRFPADKLKTEFTSADGSAVALKVLDNTEDITVYLDLGPDCNPGLVYTKVIKARPTVPIIAMEENGDTIVDNTFCLPDSLSTPRVFKITNNTDDNFQYDWILPSGWEITNATPGNTEITVLFNNNSSGNITVRATNDGCGDEFRTVNINRYSATPFSITGPSPNCINFGEIAPMTFTINGGANTYTWNVLLKDTSGNLTPSNWSFDPSSGTSGNVVTYLPTFDQIGSNSTSFVVTASVRGNCGNNSTTTSTLEVPIGPKAPEEVLITFGGSTQPVINNDFCFTPGEQYILKTNIVDFADGYEWALSDTTSGWNITTPPNSQQITLIAGTAPVSISVVATANGCNNSAPYSFQGTIAPDKPSDITILPTSTCISPTSDSTVYLGVADIPGASFTWNLPNTNRYQIVQGQGTNEIELVIFGDPNSTINDPLPGPIFVSVSNASSNCTSSSNTFNFSYGNVPDVSGGNETYISNLVYAIDQLGTIPVPTNYTYTWFVEDSGNFVPHPAGGSGPNSIAVTDPLLVGNRVKVIVTDTNSNCSSERIFVPESKNQRAVITVEEPTIFASGSRKNLFEIYPNPAKDFLNIDSKHSTIHALYIVDATGKVVFENRNFLSNTPLDVSRYPAGMYTVIAVLEKEDVVKKLLIE